MQALPQLLFKADAVIHVNSSITKLVMGEGAARPQDAKLGQTVEGHSCPTA